MKYIVTIILATMLLQSRAQKTAIKLTLVEETKDKYGKPPISNSAIEVVIDDTITLKVKTDEDGNIKIPVDPGKYKLRVNCPTFYTKEVKGIIVYSDRDSYVTMSLVTEAYLNSLSKREKRKLGYK